jgi:hypothetical protein
VDPSFSIQAQVTNKTTNASPLPPTVNTTSILPPPILATEISDDVHKFLSEATNEHGIKIANLSSIDYEACCGLGHRLARMANAAWIAKKLGLALYTFWVIVGAAQKSSNTCLVSKTRRH